MKILHTSDWHLGRALYGRKRYEEFQAFLDWLTETIEQQQVDVLIVAGDIFDTSTPNNRAQTLYYQFLCKVAASDCHHVVVVAGNHDSPSFLNAPKALLEVLNVHVVGAVSDDPADEVIVLKDEQNSPMLIVCAVPYLRDRDIRTVEAGETIEDKEQKLLSGIRQHYADVATVAQQQRIALKAEIPVIGTGHLFAAGGQTADGDGVRELYVGSLAHISASVFPDVFDYVALGHLHVPQLVGGHAHIRYSGSPLPMGFGEARQQKVVCLIEMNAGKVQIDTVSVPVFQKLEQLKGDLPFITARIETLKEHQEDVWLEISYTGSEVIPDLNTKLNQMTEESGLNILRVKNPRIREQILGQTQVKETLDDLNTKEVFERCLTAHDVPVEQQQELMTAYQEILSSLDEDDLQAE
ncbi:exonuclease SbcCD subunit D C-terminal domain-containing protein [Vibrio quintilis]|uniref:Nuclease SbcCD subunit D n=1 Tax=Vibrio quintilis TaxID=1117707 RepID=A0A1M7Z310_9VIBR|nr:exonuclease SbcCD subunit D C-terminal domain-containing protein [Vibrio quintilis]SHO59180.1 Nuclease SbcCD subunit D [Vibrio quintilis]